MIFHFSLYGFLKNQRYFEPFIVLAFLDKGFSFFLIGLLIGIREIATNFMEIPTGALADTMGRRYSMIASHVAYIAAFICLGYFVNFYLLAMAMVFFSVGEAFRTGTHKAMIFSWLKANQRLDEKTYVYGYTRSWSKMGTALSAVVAAVLLLTTQDYNMVFYVSAVPMSLGIFNFLCYPNCVESPSAPPSRLLKQGDCVHAPTSEVADRSMGVVVRTLWAGTKQAFTCKRLRSLLVEDISFEGMFKSTKDYLQPILQSGVVALPFMLGFSDTQRTVMLVAVVYAVLSVMSSVASRRAAGFAKRYETDAAATKALWTLFLACFVVVVVGASLGWYFAVAAGFVAVAVFQNLWRPILVSRIAQHTDDQTMTTVLSVESQGKTLMTAVMAPLIGFAVDYAGSFSEGLRYLPIAVLGLAVCAFFRLRRGYMGEDMPCVEVLEEGSEVAGTAKDGVAG